MVFNAVCTLLFVSYVNCRSQQRNLNRCNIFFQNCHSLTAQITRDSCTCLPIASSCNSRCVCDLRLSLESDLTFYTYHGHECYRRTFDHNLGISKILQKRSFLNITIKIIIFYCLNLDLQSHISLQYNQALTYCKYHTRVVICNFLLQYYQLRISVLSCILNADCSTYLVNNDLRVIVATGLSGLHRVSIILTGPWCTRGTISACRLACYCLYYMFFQLSDGIKVCINSMCYLCMVIIAIRYNTYGILYVNVSLYLSVYFDVCPQATLHSQM